MQKKRVIWVDIAKFICIFCVMNSHLESKTKILFSFYVPFYLSLFFFCSGYVYRGNERFSVFFRKKVKQLFVPWLVFSNLNILLSQILSFNKHKALGEEVVWNLLQIRGKGDGLWFVAALFVAYLPFYFVILWLNKKEVTVKRLCFLVCVVWGLSCICDLYTRFSTLGLFRWGNNNLPWHMEYIFFAMFYMILGYLFRKKLEVQFDKLNTKKFCAGISIIYVVLVLAFKHLFGNNPVTEIVVNYVLQLMGISAVISISKFIKPNKYILYIGENTLLCFAFHGKIYSFMQTMLKKIAEDVYYYILNDIIYSTILSVVLTIVLSVILIIPIKITNKYFPNLIGRKRNSKKS
ncbi:MAG: acyltransferase family protein [Lachnospiraceae bacterium]|nr:acyltransferase family protein [Lachnospiraceae bacterium]